MICDACHKEYRTLAVVDSEAWEAIAAGAYALCPECMDQRFKDKGMTVECDIQMCGHAMTSPPSGRALKAGAWRQPEYLQFESVGLPTLFHRG
jgi:hypothetical protein